MAQTPPRDPLFKPLFDIPEEDLRTILSFALSRGAELAEIYLEYRLYHHIALEDDIIKETAESISLGMGVRAVKGDQTGYGYTSDLRFPAMRSAALTAASISAEGNGSKAAAFKATGSPLRISPSGAFLDKPALSAKLHLVRACHAAARDRDAAVHRIKVSYSDQMQAVRVLDSRGLSRTDLRPLVKLTCVALAERGGRREAGYSGGGGRVGLDYFRDSLSPETIGREAAEEAMFLLSATPPPAGEMPVVLAPGHSGVLIHEAVGHLLEADFIRRRTSVFWDKRGKSVGSEQVTIYDDPTIPGFRGSYNVDDEGTIPRKTALIRRGRVVGLLQDRLSARILEEPPTGHGRRQDFSCIPIPRMSNTYIDRGEYDPEEILRSVNRGFYALHYQGGQVEDSGKFTFSVSSGYLIENGRLTRPVHQTTLIGTNIDILKNIEMVGSDLRFGLQTGTCGKEGQSAPVSDGCPTIKIRRMTVGGQN